MAVPVLSRGNSQNGELDKLLAAPSARRVDSIRKPPRMNRTTGTLFALLAALALLTTSPAPGQDWTLVREDPRRDIVIHERARPDGYLEFRGVTHVQSRLSAFVALFLDFETMPDWLYRTREITPVEVISDTESYWYSINSMPFPMRDRDIVLHTLMDQDPETYVLTVLAIGDPDYRPEDERYIRMPVIESSWTFIPLSDGRVQIEFSGFADPGGGMSSGLLGRFQDMFIGQAPYRSLRGLKEVIGDPKYQTAEYPFVVEPPAGGSNGADDPGG